MHSGLPAAQDGATSPIFTTLSKTLTGVLAFGYLLQLLIPSITGVFALVPARVIPCIWMIVTSSFLETHFATLLCSLLAVFLSTKVLEPVWGSRELVKYILMVGVAASFTTFIAIFAAYVLFRIPTLLYIQVHGFHGIVGALLVGIKQAMPDREAKLFHFVRIPAKFLPSLYVIGAVAAGIFLRTALVTALWVCSSMYVGWLYLRFFRVKPDTPVRGDPDPSFRFASFFPDISHVYIDPVSRACSRMIGLKPDALASARGAAAAAPLLGASRADANRRRERGARVLEERLGMKPSKPATTVVVETPPESAAPDMEAGQGKESGSTE